MNHADVPNDGSSTSQNRTLGRQLAVPIALLLPIASALAALIIVWSAESYLYPKPEFYGVAAQIIPILVVAFALEDRANQFLSDPQTKLYRAQLFLFLLLGELAALLGASGVLRGAVSESMFDEGQVATPGWALDLIAGGTAAGLVGGFMMIAVLALSGPGWLLLSFGRQRPNAAEIEALNTKVAALESRLADRDEASR